MRKEREITIKFIQNNQINYRKLADFFAKKYSARLAGKQDKYIKS